MNPYSNDLMIFDEETKQYRITEKALLSRGIDLRSRLAQSKSSSPEFVINGLLEECTDLIYSYIHEFNVDNEYQDFLIATVPALRPIIYKALIKQAVYIIFNGNLSISTDITKRSLAIDETAKRTLDTVVCELGRAITFTGAWR